VDEQIKEGRNKIIDLCLGRINELGEEMERKEQLVSALIGHTKELENELREKDSATATLKL